jgi:hypothetical protein
MSVHSELNFLEVIWRVPTLLLMERSLLTKHGFVVIADCIALTVVAVVCGGYVTSIRIGNGKRESLLRVSGAFQKTRRHFA